MVGIAHSSRKGLVHVVAASVVTIGVLAQAGGATGAIADASITLNPSHSPPTDPSAR
jgi:hypothetical protein